MVGKIKLKALAKRIIKKAKKLGADQVEVVLWNGVEELTRFANSEIHQSVALTDAMLHVRVIVGKKIGVARANSFDELSLNQAVNKALELAKLQRSDLHFTGLPKKTAYSRIARHYKQKSHIGSQGRVKAIQTIINEAVLHNLTASGAFSESTGETAVANSNNVFAYHKGTSANLSTIFTGAKGSGYASQSTKGGSEIDIKKIAEKAVFKATHGNIYDVPPGDYEVILEPPAVAEILDFFAWLGPNARIYHEDVSFFQGNIGKQLFSSCLTIVDDPLHKEGYPMAFDFEGAAKAPVTLVEGGILKSVVYDSYHAAKHKAKNTGHALLAPNTWGPTPTHIMIKPGVSKPEDLLRNIKKGLLITRFWYTRVVQHKQLTLTGMTRDGTFYIENGKIVGRVKNLRYTQSIVEAFANIRGVGNILELHGSEGSPSLVPHLHLGKFRFTGVTKHG